MQQREKVFTREALPSPDWLRRGRNAHLPPSAQHKVKVIKNPQSLHARYINMQIGVSTAITALYRSTYSTLSPSKQPPGVAELVAGVPPWCAHVNEPLSVFNTHRSAEERREGAPRWRPRWQAGPRQARRQAQGSSITAAAPGRSGSPTQSACSPAPGPGLINQPPHARAAHLGGVMESLP